MIEFPETLRSDQTIEFLLCNTRYVVNCIDEYDISVETKALEEVTFYPACVGSMGYYEGCILLINYKRNYFLEANDVLTMAYILKDRHSAVSFDVLEYEWNTLLKLADVRDTIDSRPMWERISKYLDNKKIANHKLNKMSEGAD